MKHCRSFLIIREFGTPSKQNVIRYIEIVCDAFAVQSKVCGQIVYINAIIFFNQIKIYDELTIRIKYALFHSLRYYDISQEWHKITVLILMRM